MEREISDTGRPVFRTKELLREAVEDYLGENKRALPPIGTWDVSQITDMSGLFQTATVKNREYIGDGNGDREDESDSDYDEDDISLEFEGLIETEEANEKMAGIGLWDVSKVEYMQFMFSHCASFNQPLTWNTSSVTDMSGMFEGCVEFDQPLNWNVSRVQTMDNMFETCSSFNNPLTWNGGPWDVSQVRSMSYMFANCPEFNQKLNNWNVSNVQNFEKMFYGAINFNHPLNRWDVTGKNTLDMFSVNAKIKDSYFPKGFSFSAKDKRKRNYFVKIKEYEISDAHIPDPHLQLEEGIKEEELEQWRTRFPDRGEPITTEEAFIAVCPDFMPFMDFIHRFVRRVSPNEYNAYYSKITYHFFIQTAPMGYTFNDIPKYVLIRIPGKPYKPFYSGLRYLYAHIPRFDPSVTTVDYRCTEYSYSIHLNRLIYYYNLFVAIEEKNELRGFRNTAGILIMTHGEYPNVEDTYSLTEHEGSLSNIYVCNKASVGCFGYSTTNIDESLEEYESILENMYSTIDERGMVPFDEIVTGVFVNTRTRPNCRVIGDSLGTAMINYINPNVNGYINKLYTATYSDNHCYIIDIERFHESDRLYPDYEQIMERFDYANILNIPSIATKAKKTVNKSTGELTKMKIELKDIVEYYSTVLRKQNLFIYDRSCSRWADIKERYPTYEDIVHLRVKWVHGPTPSTIEGYEEVKRELSRKTKRLAEKGYGKTRKSIRNNAKKTKRNFKKAHKKIRKNTKKQKRRSIK